VNDAPAILAPRSAQRRISFALVTTPDPVRVSPTSGDPEYANLHFVGVVGGDRPVECQRITVRVPAGQLAPHLAVSLDGVEAQVNLDDWTSTRVNDTVTLRPLSGSALLTPDTGVWVRLDRVRINPVIGSATLTVIAYWRETDTTHWEQAKTELEVGKFPADFYLRNLTASPAEIGNGEDVTLQWEASTGTTLKLLHESVQYDVTGRAEFTLPLRRSAGFYLRGSRGSAEHTLYVLVSVTDPDIDVNNLTVTGPVHTNRLESYLAERVRIQPLP
jgi:hypothetical protein